ncbi:MAG: hypothetical protein D6782_09010 [Alphaproteobacteria bacterium]|nr:MAG: hypothetical protein D6782_09010 [Alphaproteobacteria bacterium]
MAKRVQDEKPKRDAKARAWMKENISEQEARYQAIVKEMDDLEPKRKRWYAEFLEIIQTRGFNVTGDMRRKIRKSELPKKPKGRARVVF